MNDLIEQVAAKAGISNDQAQKAVEAIANFVKEKFPMLGGAVDQMFSAGGDNKEGGAAGGNPFGGFGGFGQ
jgi:hypothetical protein